MKVMSVIIIATLLVFAGAASANDAPANWKKHCLKCHGADGRGDTKMGRKLGIKDMTDSDYRQNLSVEKAFKAIKNGLKEDGKIQMKPYADKLTDEQIRGLLEFVKNL